MAARNGNPARWIVAARNGILANQTDGCSRTPSIPTPGSEDIAETCSNGTSFRVRRRKALQEGDYIVYLRVELYILCTSYVGRQSYICRLTNSVAPGNQGKHTFSN